MKRSRLSGTEWQIPFADRFYKLLPNCRSDALFSENVLNHTRIFGLLRANLSLALFFALLHSLHRHKKKTYLKNYFGVAAARAPSPPHTPPRPPRFMGKEPLKTPQPPQWQRGGRKTSSRCLRSVLPRLSDGGRLGGTCGGKCSRPLWTGRMWGSEVRGRRSRPVGGGPREISADRGGAPALGCDAAEGRCVYTTRPAGGREQECVRAKIPLPPSSSSSPHYRSFSPLSSLLSAGPDPLLGA